MLEKCPKLGVTLDYAKKKYQNADFEDSLFLQQLPVAL
jgi:hypothetical protein